MNPRLVAAAESRQLSRILALSGGPREARKRQNVGRLRRPAALRAAGPRFARLPRFARRGLASLGLAELCNCLFVTRKADARSGQVAYQTLWWHRRYRPEGTFGTILFVPNGHLGEAEWPYPDPDRNGVRMIRNL